METSMKVIFAFFSTMNVSLLAVFELKKANHGDSQNLR
jgi:hypothetical protein